MTTTPAGTMPPERYRALLETAAREFATAGYERASLNRIIRARGMSKSSFYHFFDSKAALFDAVVAEAALALATELAIPGPEAMRGPAFWDHVQALVERLVWLSDTGGWFVDLGRLVYLPDAPLEESPALRRVLEEAGAWLAAALDVGRASGAVRDDMPATLLTELALAALQAMDRWSIAHLGEVDAAERDRLAALQVDLLRRLLAP